METTIEAIDDGGGWHLSIGPYPIVDVRTQRAAEAVANLIGTISNLPDWSGAELVMRAGFLPIQCINPNRYKRLGWLWGSRLTAVWYQSRTTPERAQIELEFSWPSELQVKWALSGQTINL